MLETRRNLVVCSPTNSGKSLVGYLALAEAVKAGRRAVLLEPLRALAQENADELRTFVLSLSDAKGVHPQVCLSTGDYRLENESFESAPPEGGEIVVATPERFDAILRNPDNEPWINSIASVVVDEAHLVGTSHRGPTLELLIATLLGSARPPRLVLLSATAGDPDRLRRWLEPCDLVEEDRRSPPLSVEVWQMDPTEDADTLLCEDLARVIETADAAALVFVYRRRFADALAAKFSEKLGHPVLAYHSGMSAQSRSAVRARFISGECRCVVSTTALAMGVNLPATHVFVRDTTFFGSGRLQVDDLLQVVGRAGRGEREGQAAVLVRHNDDWNAVELAEALRTRALPPLRSAFEVSSHESRRPPRSDGNAAAQVVASCLSRAGDTGSTPADLRSLLKNTLAGPVLEAQVDPALRWLADPSRLVAYPGDDDRYRLTVLGSRGVRAVLPLDFVSGFGQLLRDLLWLDPQDRLLEQWSALDHFLITYLLTDRLSPLRRFSEPLAEQIDGWHEAREQEGKSMVFREWIVGSAAASKAEELFGSLGLQQSSGNQKSQPASRKSAYVAMLGAMILYERSSGVSVADLERRWALSNLEGVEESWRDTALWLQAGQARLCELRCFYHHLVEHCGADAARIQRVKRLLGRMRHQVFDLIERLKYCSPLGPVVRGVRGMMQGHAGQIVGAATIRRLEEAGVRSLSALAKLDADAMVELGVQRRFAKQIQGYLRRRLR